MWLGILEISTGLLRTASAGHEYPAVRKEKGEYILMKDRHGAGIVVIDGIVYPPTEIRMKPGDSVFVYTDGVPDATDREQKRFGTDRMIAALNMDPDASPKGTLENVRSAVNGFVKNAEQFDDLTMLCLQYKGI